METSTSPEPDAAYLDDGPRTKTLAGMKYDKFFDRLGLKLDPISNDANSPRKLLKKTVHMHLGETDYNYLRKCDNEVALKMVVTEFLQKHGTTFWGPSASHRHHLIEPDPRKGFLYPRDSKLVEFLEEMFDWKASLRLSTQVIVKPSFHRQLLIRGKESQNPNWKKFSQEFNYEAMTGRATDAHQAVYLPPQGSPSIKACQGPVVLGDDREEEPADSQSNSTKPSSTGANNLCGPSATSRSWRAMHNLPPIEDERDSFNSKRAFDDVLDTLDVDDDVITSRKRRVGRNLFLPHNSDLKIERPYPKSGHKRRTVPQGYSMKGNGPGRAAQDNAFEDSEQQSQMAYVLRGNENKKKNDLAAPKLESRNFQLQELLPLISIEGSPRNPQTSHRVMSDPSISPMPRMRASQVPARGLRTPALTPHQLTTPSISSSLADAIIIEDDVAPIKEEALSSIVLTNTILKVVDNINKDKKQTPIQLLSCIGKTSDRLFAALINARRLDRRYVDYVNVNFMWSKKELCLERHKAYPWDFFLRTIRRAWESHAEEFGKEDCEIEMELHVVV